MEQRIIWKYSKRPRKASDRHEKDTTENNKRRENRGTSAKRRRGFKQTKGKKKTGGNSLEIKVKSTMAKRGGKKYKILPQSHAATQATEQNFFPKR